ncbi:MAG TPA: MlaD family protein [Verrucomicrobiae bacterium]|nr:MlaD family protein [Verrucomicrobiae bacterium]
MEKSRLEIKVGLFVFIGLALLALLVIQFSKGASLFESVYNLQLHAHNVGGLKQRAGVLLAGVQVGSVSDIQLADDGKSVTILLKIYNRYKIYKDAHFVIEQSGFLGDQYVSIIPTANQGPLLVNGDEVECQEPFNLQEVARSASGLIQRVDETAKKLNASVSSLQTEVLNDQTLTNFAEALVNFREFSSEAVGTMSNINFIVNTNAAQINLAVSNLVLFSQKLTTLSDSANDLLTTNGAEISAAVKNVNASTETLKKIADDLQSGKGLAGVILQNEQLATNVQNLAANLDIASSNLNRLGLWRFLWHKEPPRTNDPAQTTQK